MHVYYLTSITVLSYGVFVLGKATTSHKLVLNIIHSNLQRNRKQSLDELISIENCTTIHIKNLQQQ